MKLTTCQKPNMQKYMTITFNRNIARIPTAFNYLSTVTYTVLFNKNSIWRNQTTSRSYCMPELCSWKMSCKSNTKFPFTAVYFLGLWNWQPHSTQSMTIPLVDIQTCTVHMYCIYSTYTFLYNIFIYNAIKM